MTTIADYIVERGLSVRLVAQKMRVTRQAVEGYGKPDKNGKVFHPTEKTLTKVAMAMTALGAPTTVLDIYTATHKQEAK